MLDGRVRLFGVSAVIDRMIQQAILQVVDIDLGKYFDMINHEILLDTVRYYL